MTDRSAQDPATVLDRAAARAGLRLGPHRRSSRFAPGRFHGNRALAPVAVDGDPWHAAARLVEELGLTGLPAGATVAEVARAAGPAERALVGWERGDALRWKVYLQNEHGFRSPAAVLAADGDGEPGEGVGADHPGPVVHLALKGGVGGPAGWSTYATTPVPDRAALDALLASTVEGLPLAGLVDALAPGGPRTRPQDALLVRDAGSTRRSVDLAAPRPRLPLDRWLATTAEVLDALAVDPADVLALGRAHGTEPVARVAVGTDARGAPFLTLYH